jgi:hypothetical protein
MNVNKLLGGLVAFVVLVGLFFASTVLRDRYADQGPTHAPTVEDGYYTIKNSDLGYQFEMPERLFRGYQEERQGYRTVYHLPTTNPILNRDGVFYDATIEVLAIPKANNDKFKAMCASGQELSPRMCQDFSGLEHSNNLYYFEILGIQSSELLSSTDPLQVEKDAKKYEELLAAVESKFQTSSVQKPQTLLYQDLQANYQYEYPTDLSNDFGESLGLPLPYSLNSEAILAASPGIIKTLPIRYCGLSGECKPTTTNMSVAVGLINTPEEILRQSQIGPSLEKTTVGQMTVYSYSEGAEGEGINYYFVIDQKTKRVVVVAQRYLDENILFTYKNAKGFIPLEVQNQITSNIIKSITFLEPLK